MTPKKGLAQTSTCRRDVEACNAYATKALSTLSKGCDIPISRDVNFFDITGLARLHSKSYGGPGWTAMTNPQLRFSLARLVTFHVCGC